MIYCTVHSILYLLTPMCTLHKDLDGDGKPDSEKDSDGDGIPDYKDDDDDNDGIILWYNLT